MEKRNMQEEKHILSRKRVVEHGEVFTPMSIVNAMLDLVKQETENIESRFLEPACGKGNFLCEILRRKLKIVEKRYKKSQFDFEYYAIIAVSSIYGIDILEDNVKDCREILFQIFDEIYTNLFKTKVKDECRKAVKFILEKNVIWGDALTLKSKLNEAEDIVFSEWSPLGEGKIKRRDFIFKELVESKGKHLFSDETGYVPIREYSPVFFLRIFDEE